MAVYDPDAWPACWILALIARDDLHAFYVSGLWKKKRLDVIKAQRGLCWDCLNMSPARLRKGVTVHHVQPIRLRPDLALSDCDETGAVNLVCLCASHHWDRHHCRREAVTEERW